MYVLVNKLTHCMNEPGTISLLLLLRSFLLLILRKLKRLNLEKRRWSRPNVTGSETHFLKYPGASVSRARHELMT